VGGNISSAYHLFGDVFEQTLLEEKSTTEVALSELKENAALLGSAYLFNDKFWEAVQPALPLM
jgi:glucokinase